MVDAVPTTDAQPRPLPWEEPGWFERVEAWAALELGRLGLEPRGSLELVRTRPWAAVARVATPEGDVWFKEAAPALAFEPALTVAVSRRCPGFTPEVLAAEGAWLCTRDAGPQLRSVLKSGEPAPSWDELLPRYAELQIELADDMEEVLGLGIPDKRPTAVSSAYLDLVDRVRDLELSDRALLKGLQPELQLLAEALEGALPPTVIHEEVHDGNVFVRAGHASSTGARRPFPTPSPGSSTRSATSPTGGDSSRTAGRCSGCGTFISSPGHASRRLRSCVRPSSRATCSGRSVGR